MVTRLSFQRGAVRPTLCSGAPSAMFFTESVATTVLCVFSIAAQMTNASGSNRRAARRAGLGVQVVIDQRDDLVRFLAFRSSSWTFCCFRSAASRL